MKKKKIVDSIIRKNDSVTNSESVYCLVVSHTLTRTTLHTHKSSN